MSMAHRRPGSGYLSARPPDCGKLCNRSRKEEPWKTITSGADLKWRDRDAAGSRRRPAGDGSLGASPNTVRLVEKLLCADAAEHCAMTMQALHEGACWRL